MLDGPHTFVPLPREKTLFTSPPRTTLTLQTPNTFPGKEPFSVKCSDGKAIITNQRLIYLPTTPTLILGLAPTAPQQQSQRPTLDSFSAPLLSLQDTHVTAPFFGPNVWEGVLLPVPNGGIPNPERPLPLKLTFKEGGAFDFSTTYERIKETLAQAMDMARESGRPVNGADVDLEQLPAYEELGGGARAPVPIQRPTPVAPNGVHRPAPAANNGVVGLGEGSSSGVAPTPDEPPPGYDEVVDIGKGNATEQRTEKN